MKKLFILGMLLSVTGMVQAQKVYVTNNTGEELSLVRFKVSLEGKNDKGEIENRKGSAHIRNIAPGRTKSVNLDTATKRNRHATEKDPNKAYKGLKLYGSTPLGKGLKDTEITQIRKIRANLAKCCPGLETGACDKSFKGICRKAHDSGRLDIFAAPTDTNNRYEVVIDDNKRVVVKQLKS